MAQPSERLRLARQAQAEDLAAGATGGELARSFGDAIESLVRDLAGPVVADAGTATLVAVGGLGRRELAPYADLDLVLVVPEVVDADVDPLVRSVVHPLWDLGLKVNLVVHDPESWIDAAQDDLAAATAVLDARPLVGPPEHIDAVWRRAQGRLFGDARQSLLEALAADIEERHGRLGATVFVVEPDLKFGPGGLRDLASLRWALQATHGEHRLDALSEAGQILPGMAQTLTAAHDTLLRLRCALHLVARRVQERLGFSYQEALPAALGRATPEGDDAALVAEVEAVMQDYYRAASHVLRFGARLRDRCRVSSPAATEPPRRIDERFQIIGRELCHRPTVSFAETPVLALEALALARDHQVTLSGETADAIAEAMARGEAASLEHEPEAQDRLADLLVEPYDLTAPTALAECVDLGLVEAVIPAFGPIRGRMQHDTYHVFTVDQHTLSAVALLKAIARGEHKKDFPLATALHLEIDDPRVLYLATLAHDLGKATSGDQCETGGVIAREVAGRAALAPEQVDRCALLVREHLTMPLLSLKRDLTDPALIEDFAGRVGDRETLRELYLLSLVDTASVRPGNLTSWKLTLLDELYLQTSAQLRRGRIRAERVVARSGEPASMPRRYYSLFHLDLRRHHGALVQRLESEQRAATLELSGGSGAPVLTLVARDRPGLLAHAAAVLDDHGIEVLAADVFSAPGPRPIVIDVFRVAPERGHDPTLHAPAVGVDRQTVAAAEAALQRGLDPGELDASPPPRQAPPLRAVTEVPTRISFFPDASGRRSIVEVQTRAGADVLRRVTRAFAAEGIEILLARCDTEAARSSHVYYVALLEDPQRECLEQRLRDYLR